MSDRLTRRLGEFALVPRSLASRASGNALRLWCILWVYSGNGTHAAWPSHETLAGDLGVSDRTIRRCLKELEDLGFLTCGSRPGTSCLYVLEWGVLPVDKARFLDTDVRMTPDTDVLPPRTQMSYKERLSEIDNQPDSEPDTKLSREQVRDIVTMSAFCPTCSEKLSRCACDVDGSGRGVAASGRDVSVWSEGETA
jgi:Helix-turn-helix domain